MLLLDLCVCLKRQRIETDLQAPLTTATYKFQFDQLIDHFDNTNTATFKQKYLVNTEQCKSAVCPIFLHIGGESPLPDTALDGVKYANFYFAKELGAITVALEHRYYGDSYPSADLQYLSSKQAQADIVRFLQFIKTSYKQENAKVIVQGGSYPGALSGWLRNRFPHMIDVSLSSSGPFMGMNEYTDYLKHIQGQFQRVGCLDKLHSALSYTEECVLSDRLRKKFIAAFDVIDSTVDWKNEMDIANVLEAVTDGLAGLVQYAKAPGYDGTDYQGELEMFCTELNAAATMEQQMTVLGAHNKLTGVKLSYSAYIASLQEDSSSRSWFYQTCTEFGYYQTAVYPDSVFSQRINMDYFMHICNDAFFTQFTFEETKTAVQEMIDYTNAFYGGRNVGRTHIYFTNGRVDPWSELSVVQEKKWIDGQWMSKESVVEWIELGSHCTDMNLIWKINDGLRTRQLEKIKEWIA
ncbi:Serine_carboxypeptidase [Hexamita inflata]|uniref:Serine carboxypeptidase n=1 Tax=Hexamita inflata TaxID=28002 RepID=A0AA86UKE1_9EUKA|nr:Serine carboxypeptidase [Hexamita inflata]